MVTEEMLAHGRQFVESREYERFSAGKYPRKRLAVLTCMDTRLVELLPAALGIRNGDVNMIKNAGGMLTGPYDGAVRSLLVAVLDLRVEEVLVIGHTDCGVSRIGAAHMLERLRERGVSQEAIDEAARHVDFETWFRGFDRVEDSVAETVELLRRHPLMPGDVSVSGYVMDSETGALTFLK